MSDRRSDRNGFEMRKDLFADERDDDLNEIGKRIRRQDIEGHVTGRSPFYDDHLFDGLLHIRCVRSPHHHARIRRIDTSEADRMEGVVRIVTGRDVPVNLNTLLSLLDFGLDDEPLLSEGKVAYRGEPVAAVIARTEAQARAATRTVRVDWEVLPHVLDVEEALKPGAPTVNETYPGNAFVYHGKYDHQKLRYGDVDRALAEADHVIEGRYQMSPIEQAPIETCGAIAAQEQNGRYVCYTGTQALFFSLGTASKLLELPSSRLHFIGGTVGGGFGGKVDSIHEPLAILGTMLTGQPCKSQWDREEEMQVGAPRGAERWYLTDGVMNDGRIVARKFTGYFDSGAYTRLTSYAVIKCAGHLPGPYTIPNVHADVYCVYTNRTPATAMRGFGITGVDFAIEAHMDKVAETVGLHPVELRILNAYRDGDMKAHRRLAKNCALVECCQVAAQKAGLRLSPDMLAASSKTGGGGPRAELPAHTATDQNGLVEGFSSGSYARKGGAPASPAIVATLPPGASAPASRPAAPAPEPKDPAPRPDAPRADTSPPARKPARSGAMRFSSLSGFRRR
ncbi:xanthine dehydrogenase family protein molybdopterin-binding subunit [Jannaschia aquimarina]|uniref:NdhL protein n=1 Tax=Jannaschia aquimarina TaxID=935700 RepID=A0A0D1EH69_9RHOB|nr:molybdopterin cofactor-binding domain-containing protein [Jannaschia aquimarina]KIT16226.1 Nicotinate dehydrogenase large molybdopterin subunit [Jannaschia aquimarina]SNT15786.1 Aldehyde oxidase and xanthine dehydrogenase, a/b hammerhead domain [Jannaschia aquimarina]